VTSLLSAHDVARELRRRLPSAGVLKTQKLLYFCMGWSVAWNDDPLSPERLEAWEQGPVVADVWHDEHRGRPLPAERRPSDRQTAAIDYVVERYGRYTGEELKALTHREDPWRSFAGADGVLRQQNAEITDEALLAWFRADDAYRSFWEEADRLRRRRDVYGLDGPVLTSAIEVINERVLRGRAEPPAQR
jgi:uncharacterized phage-associated protein